MSAAECPYCGADNDICHDDGYGYDESQTYEQECHSCSKVFAFTICFSINYDTFQAPCMNGEDHLFEPTHTAPKWHTKMRCKYCDETRDLTEQEKIEHNIPPIPGYYLSNA